LYIDLGKYGLSENEFINQTINSDVKPDKMFRDKLNKLMMNSVQQNKFNEDFCTF